MDGFAPIKGKCYYWREAVDDDDRFNTRVKKTEWRVRCTCFVLGDGWTYTVETVPADCPERRTCRYYIYNS